VLLAAMIRTGTASTVAILRRFMKANVAHRTYQAMLEVGCGQRTIFLARYPYSRDMHREVGEGLTAVEAWNGATRYYSEGGDMAGNRATSRR
jgi:TnpA family transposase